MLLWLPLFFGAGLAGTFPMLLVPALVLREGLLTPALANLPPRTDAASAVLGLLLGLLLLWCDIDGDGMFSTMPTLAVVDGLPSFPLVLVLLLLLSESPTSPCSLCSCEARREGARCKRTHSATSR